MCYSQGDGFNTSPSRLCTTHESLTDLLVSVVYGECLGLCIVLGVVAGGMVMCYSELH